MSSVKHFYAVIDYGDVYVQPLILSALAARLPKGSYTLLPAGSNPPNPDDLVLYIRQYEDIPFETLMAHPSTVLANAYVIRKALIRKHYLSTTAHNWVTKNPGSALATHIKPTVSFEVDYAEFLDEALVEAWELHESFARNAGRGEAEKEWWILKPGMSDRGQGIRLFDSEIGLQEIFEEWEAERPDSDDEDEDEHEDGDETASPRPEGVPATTADEGEYIMTSQLRHFVAQPYIHPPLLLAGNPHKFHIRTYVVAVGALKVYVYRPMLALFAGTPYAAPWTAASSDSDSGAAGEGPDLRAHLTNTCLQDGSRDGAVRAFWALGAEHGGLPGSWREDVFGQICETAGEVFEAAARSMGVHFQPLPNAFEVFGVDFLVDGAGTPWLLEINAFPDFKQTGEELGGVIRGLWEGVLDVAVCPFFGGEERESGDMVLVRTLDLGRR